MGVVSVVVREIGRRVPGTRVAVVGGGPRCLDLVERLVCRADGRPLEVHVVEPGPLGVGGHPVNQPDFLLLNTVCEQVTGFTDAAMLDRSGNVVGGPSLFAWARDQGVLVDGRAVRGTDHLPRALLGRYLAWVAERILAAAPDSVRVHVHRTSAVAVTPVPGGERIDLVGEPPLVVDRVVVAIGHGGPSPHLPAVLGDGPYPLPDVVAGVSPDETVALLGVGLTGMDVLAALTVGRGGRFADGVYVPSGREPHVVLVSRQGRPMLARPRLNPGRRALAARRLTAEALGDGPLDFADDVLPLVVAEMTYRWHAHGGSGPAPDFVDLLLGGPPPAALRSLGTYRDWYAAQVAADLDRAVTGLGVDPLKEALEVLRDHRDVLRAAVDHDRLTPASHEWFHGVFAGAANRVVIGPQRERHAELLALVAAGVVSIGPGPGPVVAPDGTRVRLTSTGLAEPASVLVDRVLVGHSAAVDPARSANPLLAALTAAGRLSRVTALGRPVGVRVDRDLCAVGVDGRAQSTLHVFGPLAEGSTYYNHYVTSPGGPSRATADADRLAERLLTPLAHETDETHEQERTNVPA